MLQSLIYIVHSHYSAVQMHRMASGHQALMLCSLASTISSSMALPIITGRQHRGCWREPCSQQGRVQGGRGHQ